MIATGSGVATDRLWLRDLSVLSRRTQIPSEPLAEGLDEVVLVFALSPGQARARAARARGIDAESLAPLIVSVLVGSVEAPSKGRSRAGRSSKTSMRAGAPHSRGTLAPLRSVAISRSGKGGFVASVINGDGCEALRVEAG